VAVFSYYYRTCCSIIDPTPTTQQGSATFYRSNHTISHAPRTRWASIHRVRTMTLPFTRSRSPAKTCKNLATPYDYKRGARAHIQGRLTKTRTQCKITHTHPSEQRVPLCPPHKVETWDLALSRNLLVYPCYKNSRVQGNTDSRSHTGRRAFLARTSIILCVPLASPSGFRKTHRLITR